MFRDAKVLVAGGTGFIGTNLAMRLAAHGAQVCATKHERPIQVEDPRIRYESADLRCADDCARVVTDIDYVFMCAANTSGAAVMRLDPLAHVTPNVIMNTLILEASHRARVKKFVFISSGAAYPATGD